MNSPIRAEDTGIISSLSVVKWGALCKWEAKHPKAEGWMQGERGCINLWISSWWYTTKAVKDTFLLENGMWPARINWNFFVLIQLRQLYSRKSSVSNGNIRKHWQRKQPWTAPWTWVNLSLKWDRRRHKSRCVTEVTDFRKSNWDEAKVGSTDKHMLTLPSLTR